jgi:hypothetical protein
LSTWRHPLKPCGHCGISTRRTCDLCGQATCVESARIVGKVWACEKCLPSSRPTKTVEPPAPVVLGNRSRGVSRLDARCRDVLEDQRLAFARGQR